MVPLTERIDRLQRAHRELKIAAPWATRSGYWEVSVQGKADTTAYDNGHRMMDVLEARYADVLPPAQAWLAERGYLRAVPGAGMVVTPPDHWPAEA